MGDHDNIVIPCHIQKHSLQLLFGRTVDIGRRLVQQQDWWIAEDSAYDCQTLPLPARKTAPGLTDIGPVSLRQVDNELMRVSKFGRTNDLPPLTGPF